MVDFEKTSQEEVITGINSVEELDALLKSFNIQTDSYGRGEAKDLDHLLTEIKQGETILVKQEDQLLRRVVVGGADIYYIDPQGKKLRLVEAKQVFDDGRERRRDLGNAVSEKFKAEESDPESAMLRGIGEEIGVEGNIELESLGKDTDRRNSPSYPGLESEYVTHRFRAELNDDQFKPNGTIIHNDEEFAFVEKQEGRKDTYFSWIKE